MLQLEYNEAAREDLLAITRYIRMTSGSRDIARSFANALRRQCEKIATLPGTIGRPRSELKPDLRSFAFKGYVILFRYAADMVVIVNIIERHRDIVAEFDADSN